MNTRRKTREPSANTSSPGWRGLLLVAALALLPYLLLPPNTFVADSTWITEKNQVMREGSLAEVWTTDFWGLPMNAPYATRSYRPLVSMSYLLTVRAFGFEARAFHLVDMLLHAGGCVLFALLIGTLLPRSRWTIPMAILFALHPLLSEAVASFVGRADMMGSIGMLAALVLHLRASSSRRPWLLDALALLLVGAALLSKEYAVAAPFILIAVDGARFVTNAIKRHERNRIFITWGIAFALLIAYLALRVSLTGALGGVPMVGVGDMPLVGKSLGVRWGTAAWLLVVGLRLMLLPTRLNYFYSAGTVDLARGLFDPRALAGMLLVVLWIGLAIYLMRSRREIVPLVGATLFFLPLGPTLNTVSVTGVLYAERFLYLPLAGLLLCFAYLLERNIHNVRRTRQMMGAIVLVCVVFGALTMARVHEWGSELSLVDSALRSYPRAMAANLAKGMILADPRNSQHNPAEAIVFFERALEIEQRNPQLWTRYAESLTELGKASNAPKERRDYFQKAVAAREHAVDLSPGDVPSLWLWLGEAQMRVDKLQDAVASFRRAYQLETANEVVAAYLANGLLRLAQASLNRGEKDESLARVDEAIATSALPAEGLFLAAQVLSRAGEKARARTLYDRAITADPELLRRRHARALEAERAGKHLLAASLFREILDAQPKHVPTLFNLGRSLVLAGHPREAIDPLAQGLTWRDDRGAREWLRRARREAAATR